MKTLSILGIVLLMLASITTAEDLILSDLDVKVRGSTDHNLHQKDDNYEIKHKAKPGDSLTVEIELENEFDKDLYDDEDDDEIEERRVDMQDIEIEVRLSDIDDGDDITITQTIDKIKSGKKKTVEFVFQEIPELIEAGDYDLSIFIDGEDERGSGEFISHHYVLVVEKEPHDLRIKNVEVTPPITTCGKDVELTLDVRNFGSTIEDDFRVVATSEDLGWEYKYFDTDVELLRDLHEDALHEVEIPIVIGDIAEQEYAIDIALYHDVDELADISRVHFAVAECKSAEEKLAELEKKLEDAKAELKEVEDKKEEQTKELEEIKLETTKAVSDEPVSESPNVIQAFFKQLANFFF